jgi:hypothetical protein
MVHVLERFRPKLYRETTLSLRAERRNFGPTEAPPDEIASLRDALLAMTPSLSQPALGTH